MTEITEDIWRIHREGYVVCVTTNGTFNKSGELVMGAGVAKTAKFLYPDLPLRLGRMVARYGNVPLYLHDRRIITFPVKHLWFQKADINLITKSAKRIAEFFDIFELHKIHTVRPGCGNGGLKWEDVKLVLEPIFDDRIIIVNS